MGTQVSSGSPGAQGGKGFEDFGNEVSDKPRSPPGAAEFLKKIIKKLHLPELYV